MAAFSDFLIQLLDQGKVVFRSAKPPQDRPTERDAATLADAFATFALSVAGPPIAFDARTACEAAELVRRASWALVSREERVDDLKRRLVMSATPNTPGQHLSADLLLRYLPQILRRVRGLDPTDPLIDILADVLRRWPLSGVLSDVEEGPLGPTDFGGHPGLLILYSERLTADDRPAWRPEPTSPAYEHYQLVTGDDLV
jgi:MoxR-vWA-beta-propeller ternary system domain bpX4